MYDADDQAPSTPIWEIEQTKPFVAIYYVRRISYPGYLVSFMCIYVDRYAESASPYPYETMNMPDYYVLSLMVLLSDVRVKRVRLSL